MCLFLFWVCQFLLHIYFRINHMCITHLCVCVCVLVNQLCLTLCNYMNCSSLGFSVHEVLQARILEWVAIPFSRGSSWLRDQTMVSCIVGRFFTIWATREAHNTFSHSIFNWLDCVGGWGSEQWYKSTVCTVSPHPCFCITYGGWRAREIDMNMECMLPQVLWMTMSSVSDPEISYLLPAFMNLCWAD